jgi:hypothetical protein
MQAALAPRLEIPARERFTPTRDNRAEATHPPANGTDCGTSRLVPHRHRSGGEPEPGLLDSYPRHEPSRSAADDQQAAVADNAGRQE